MNEYGLFEATGVELEYMIVRQDSLDVEPIADVLLHRVAGAYEAEVALGPLAWSNELAMHVLEFKTNGPTVDLPGSVPDFDDHVRRANRLLGELGACLMPTAMHPWMDPHAELRLWPHEYSPVYEAFNRIFDCSGHGWANLQSAHVNLPFASDEEFGRLHSAIRLVLPLVPALAASSPIVDGRVTGTLDTRLDVYRTNTRRIPSVTGRVIPEPAMTRAEYEARILEPMYRAIAPHDPDGILRHEWLNARGAIARFDRGAIEIRVIDVQECPLADVTVAAAVVALVRALVENRDALRAAATIETERLVEMMMQTLAFGEQARIEDREYLALFDDARPRRWAGDFWSRMVEEWIGSDPAVSATRSTLEHILNHGPLARRILHRLDASSHRAGMHEVYQELCVCLDQGRVFGDGVA